MSWKKNILFFIWQSISLSGSVTAFTKNLAYRQRWINSFQKGRNSVIDELPWLNFLALEYLENLNLNKFRVFEFGGGGSTLFFCKNGAQVTTVEDHAAWFQTLTDTVTEKSYKNWEGIFVQPETYRGTKTDRDPANPGDFKSGAPGLGHLSFEAYARSIDRFEDASFDIILVDGRARPSCMEQSITKLKPGGLLIIDNTERSYYLTHLKERHADKFELVLHGFAPVYYTPDFTITTIYKKKA